MGEEVTGQLMGMVDIGDNTTPLLFDVTARQDSGGINVLAEAEFSWQDMGLTKPTARLVVFLADEVQVEALLIAKPAP